MSGIILYIIYYIILLYTILFLIPLLFFRSFFPFFPFFYSPFLSSIPSFFPSLFIQIYSSQPPHPSPSQNLTPHVLSEEEVRCGVLKCIGVVWAGVSCLSWWMSRVVLTLGVRFIIYYIIYYTYYIIYYYILFYYYIIIYYILYSSFQYSSPLLFLNHPHSFYTCRYLHILIYILLPNTTPAQTPILFGFGWNTVEYLTITLLLFFLFLFHHSISTIISFILYLSGFTYAYLYSSLLLFPSKLIPHVLFRIRKMIGRLMF